MKILNKIFNNDTQLQISQNIKVHDLIANKYERFHSEIFNDIEQERLFEALRFAGKQIKYSVPTSSLQAFDFGCGSGNLTRHLIELNFDVTSADVSVEFLKLINKKFGKCGNIKTQLLNGKNLDDIKSNSFDLVATYSVLQHIPDYLSAVKDMIRICKPNGIIFIDHERTDEFWNINKTYNEFISKATKIQLRKYFYFRNFIGKLRRLFGDNHYSNEGDIHVWPDDNISWLSIKELLLTDNCEILKEENYLQYKKAYKIEVYNAFRNKCSDTKLLIARKGYSN